MDVDPEAPDPVTQFIEELDARFDVTSLAAAFGSERLRIFFKTSQSPPIEKCPVLMHIMRDAQTLLQELMYMPFSHGAWKQLDVVDNHRPTEAQITLISMKTSFVFHHLLIGMGKTEPLVNRFSEICA